MINNRKPNEKLWKQAIESNDVELAIKAAIALNDLQRLRLIALEAWSKKQFSIVEKASLGLGFRLDKTSCSKIEKIVKKNNLIPSIRDENALILQDVFDCLFYANQEGLLITMLCVMVVKSETKLIFTTLDDLDSDIIFCELMDGEYKYRHKLKNRAYQIYPTTEQQNFFEKIARHDPLAVFMELVPKKTLDITELALNDLENYNDPFAWGRFCELLNQKRIELTAEQVSRIEEKLRFWSNDSRIFKYEQDLPTIFARKISSGYCPLNRYMEKSPSLKNITCLEISGKRTFEAALANPYMINITTLILNYFSFNVSQELLVKSLWLSKIKKLFLRRQGKIETTIAFLNQCPFLEEVETYTNINKEAAGILGKLENLNSLSIRGCFFDHEEFFDHLPDNRLQKLKISDPDIKEKRYKTISKVS